MDFFTTKIYAKCMNLEVKRAGFMTSDDEK